MASKITKWFGALVATGVASYLSVQFIDLPVANWVHAHPFARGPIKQFEDLVLLLVPLGALALLIGGFYAFAGRVRPRWLETSLIASNSLMWSLAAFFFLLKPAFGRIETSKLFAEPSQYGFVPFHGGYATAYPSGHSAMIASVMIVIGLCHPRLRIVSGLVTLAVMAGLVLIGWHFVADTIGGLFLGATTALMSKAMWDSRASGHGP
ncbi:MAG: phosphatase PAP2 family protein [Parvibaculum sp.]|nr:phosphatase PAP2 family protein [Parvibaculum sp.]